MRDTSGCLSRKPGIRFHFLFLFPYLFCSIRPSPFVPVSLMPHKSVSFPSVLCLTSFMPSLLLASIIVMTLSLVYLPLVIHLSGFSKTLDHIIFLCKSHQWYPLIPGKCQTLYTKGLQALLLSDPVALTLTPFLSCFLCSRQAEGLVCSRVCPAVFCLYLCPSSLQCGCQSL